jgi:hypothetical protein
MGYVKSRAGISGSVGGRVSKATKKVVKPVTQPIKKAVSQASNILAKAEDVVKEKVLPNPLTQIALAYYMPGLVAQFAPSLGALGVTSAAAQTAVANAIATTTVQVAQGVPFDKAFQNAVTNAVVFSGSPAIAKDINKIIENPAVTNAIVSAGASAAKTALNGGSKSDIERNLIAGLVGSGTATATGSNIAGSAAAGGVTGGVTGALTGAASAYGAQLEAERLAKEKAEKTVVGTSADPGIKVAGGDDATALNMASISAKPEMLGKSGETASALTSRVDEGVTIYERTITGKTPDGKEYSYTATYDPSAPANKQISYTSSGVVKDAQGNVIPTGGGSATSSFTRPDFTAAATTGTYTPTIITPVTPITPTPIAPILPAPTRPVVTPTGPVTDEEVIDVMQPPAPIVEPSLAPVTVIGQREPTLQDTDITLPETTVIGKREEDTLPEVTVKAGEEEKPIAEEPTVDDKGEPYRPNLFIYGGTKPSTLSQTLGTNLPSARTTTGTSVGLGGRGEIESKESGKKRQTVWNEESLRLKDALGL